METKEALEAIIRSYVDLRLSKCQAAQRFTPAELRTLFFMPSVISVVSCQSTNVRAYGYNKDSQALAVQFTSGGEYRYLAVQAVEFTLLEQSDSKGRTIQEIKQRHAYVRWI